MLPISCNLLNTVPKVKNRMVGRMGMERCKHTGCSPLWLCGGWGAAASCCFPASPENITLHITSLGKHQNSKFKVRFLLHVYCFHTIIKLRNVKSNYCKSGTICTGIGWRSKPISEFLECCHRQFCVPWLHPFSVLLLIVDVMISHILWYFFKFCYL